jgi:hypothetical protein
VPAVQTAVHNRGSEIKAPAPAGRRRMIEKLLAAIVLALCVVLLLRMMLRPAARQRVDRAAQRAWWWCRDAALRISQRPRAKPADAAREAQAAIDRASRKKRTLH